MRWKYYIPHTWDPPSLRVPWAEIWLLPDDPNYKGKSIWLTIDALGDPSDPTHGSERAEFQRDALKKLGSKDLWIDGSDMIVRVRDFNKKEFLNFVKVWLNEVGLSVTELREAPFEDFKGTNQMAEIAEILIEKYLDGNEEETNSSDQ